MMEEKIKDFFTQEKHFSKFALVAILSIVAFVFVFIPSGYAQFLRQTGSTGWGYGYGYGYGYGFGWDSGHTAGYKTDFTYTAEDEYGYGFGYGYLAGSYNSSTGITLTSASNLNSLYEQGIVNIAGGGAATATSASFNDKLTLNLTVSAGTLTVTIPSGTTLTKTAGGTFDTTAFTASDEATSAGGISGKSIRGAIQFGLPTVGLTSDTAITISIPVSTSLNGQTLNVYKSSTSASSGYSSLTTCTISSGLCTFTTTSLSYFAATQTDSSTTNNNQGGGGGTPVTEAEKQVTVTPTDVTIEVSDVVANPADVNSVLSALGLTRNTSEESKYAPLVVADLKEFKVTATDNEKYAMNNFVVYGISTATQKFGAGERRAILRDYLEIVGRANVIWSDIEKMATGQKLVNRNLTKEQSQLGVVLQRFEKLFGHRPNFKDAKEDLAWNTMMYRIRFTRDLNKEKAGIVKYKAVWKKNPVSPLDWSVVRAWGYIY